MARLGRYFLPDQPLHVIQRGNNRKAIFFCAEDCARTREWLAAAAAFGPAHDGVRSVGAELLHDVVEVAAIAAK